MAEWPLGRPPPTSVDTSLTLSQESVGALIWRYGRGSMYSELVSGKAGMCSQLMIRESLLVFLVYRRNWLLSASLC